EESGGIGPNGGPQLVLNDALSGDEASFFVLPLPTGYFSSPGKYAPYSDLTAVMPALTIFVSLAGESMLTPSSTNIEACSGLAHTAPQCLPWFLQDVATREMAARHFSWKYSPITP